MLFPKIKLKQGKEKSFINRHPWIFSGAIATTNEASEGDIVEVVDFQNKFLAYGFYSQQSQISCRLFEMDQNNNLFDSKEWWKAKINAAYQMRMAIPMGDTNCYRLLHAEGDFLPGVIADVYDSVVVLQLLIVGIEKKKDLLIHALTELGFKYIYLKNKSNTQNTEEISLPSGWLTNKADTTIVVKENGIRFKIDFETGQKTGFFLDQRDSRMLLQTLSKGKKVLNTFSYTGGFSAYAIAGEAMEVVSVDISESAIQQADENVRLNFPNAKHRPIAADCFDFLGEIKKGEYDIIILDPPAFAKNARSVTNASKGYKQINLKAFNKIKPGGIVFTFSCSQHIDASLFRKIVFGAASDAKRNVRILYQLHQPFDHPINIFHPEGEYLKGLVLWVE